MLRPFRIEFEGAVYHLYARGNERQRVFRRERDRVHFLELLERCATRYLVSVLAFVLMGNHFHLIAQTARPNLSRWMHWLMVSSPTLTHATQRPSGEIAEKANPKLDVGEGLSSCRH